MSRVAAWCILFTIRVASVFNRVIYSIVEWMCGFVDTVLQVYLSSSDSDVRFPALNRKGSYELTRREVETHFEDIDLLSQLQKIQTAGRLIRKKSKAKKGKFIRKNSNNSTENHLLVSKKIKLNKFEKLILSYKFREDSDDSSSSLDSTEDESSNANKYNVEKTKTVSIPDSSKQNITENELNVQKSENYFDRDKNKSNKLDESNSAFYSEKISTKYADEMPSNAFIEVPNGAKGKIDMKRSVSEESNGTHPEGICVAPENISCINPSEITGEHVRNSSSVENLCIATKHIVSQNKDVSVSSHNIKQTLNGENRNNHDTHTSCDASKITSFKPEDLCGKIDFSTQHPKTEQRENDQTKLHQNQKDIIISTENVSPKQNSADAEKNSIIAVSIHAKTTDVCSIPKPNVPETTEPVLNTSNVMETLGEGHLKTQDTEKQDTETISQEPNLEQVNEKSAILGDIRSMAQTLTEEASADSPIDISSGINVLLEANGRETLKVALDTKNQEINNVNSPSKDTQLKDIAVTVPTSRTATCVQNQNGILESGRGTEVDEKLRNETDVKNKIEEPSVSLKSSESVETSKNNIKKLEDTDKGTDEVRNNLATIEKMEKESALKRKKYEERFCSDGEADDTDPAVMRYINDRFKELDKHRNTQHGNSSDESNSATSEKSEATNKEEGEKSKKINPIEMKDSLEVSGDIQMETKDTKASQKPELSEANETVNASSEVKQSTEQTLTVSSAKDSSTETLEPLQIMSEEIFKKDKDEAANENRETNNEKDISEKITQKTDIKESTVPSSKTAVSETDQDKLSENGHNSEFSVKSKVENEIGGKSKTEQLIANSLNSYDGHNYEDYIKLVEDTDQNSNEVKNNYKTLKKMEAECAQKLNKYREQYYSDYEDKETDAAVIEYINSRIKNKIMHPYESSCTEPHGDITEFKSNKSEKGVPNKKNNKKSKKKTKSTN